MNQITGQGKINYYDYYDNREKGKLRKAEELKDNCYQSMKNTIEAKYKEKGEIFKQKRVDTKRSVEELQKFLLEEKIRKGDRKFKNEYRDILETQVKMKKQPQKFKVNDSGPDIEEPDFRSSQSKREMYMIPGINSISPFAKSQQKGKFALGEHYTKMKNYIDHKQVSYYFLTFSLYRLALPWQTRMLKLCVPVTATI